jgi:glucokinase
VFSFPCLVADVGGTNARFAVVADAGAPLSPMLRLATGDCDIFADTVRDALRLGSFPQPRSFLAAIAGPLDGNTATLTNARTASGKLAIDGPALVVALGLEQGMLFNDFEALCLSLPALGARNVMPLGGGTPLPDQPLVVVGPGTGLGVAALVPVNGRFQPVASEGGHVSAGPLTDQERELWPLLDVAEPSAEELLSGRGLVRFHQALARAKGTNVGEQTPAGVTECVLQGDALAVEATTLFLDRLGSFAGDMALTFCARGGVFIGGGVAPRFRHLLAEGGFRVAFERKGRQADYLGAIPTALITAPDAALRGLAAVAADPDRFVLDYPRRLWV